MVNVVPIPQKELQEIYGKYKFGNIRKVDRQKYFPVDKITKPVLPWTNKGSEKHPQRKPKTIVFGSIPSAIDSAKPQDTAKPSATLWSSLLKSSEAPEPKPAPKPIPKKVVPIDPLKIVNVAEKAPSIRPRGLINNGNMCFMNSILQPLVHCPPFYNFISGISKLPKNLKTRTPIIDAMIEFISEFNISDEVTPTEDAIKSQTNMEVLRGRQEDAEEFMVFLLDGLHEELLKTIDKPAVEIEQPTDDWKEVGKKNKTVVTQRTERQPSQMTRIFGGSHRSVVKSGNSKESITLEPFQTLQLDISSKKIATLEDAIVTSTLQEVLDDFNSTSNSQTTKQSFIENIPPILIITLKRFVYDVSKAKTLKIFKHIEIPAVLKLPKEIMSPANRSTIPPYKLFAGKYN
ncbi:hypothetical protein HK103_007324 [Boothiomyces macroporosus]|uniref:ubiquitinyl hydrolase 1 n=1 Tax=Boothiomyces macroporosus TaxID=261099 RepID=A0AAD5UKP5_9FUNG|nr:hypothetical protein HK103_007324 [Boothiomyces macroporosus]